MLQLQEHFDNPREDFEARQALKKALALQIPIDIQPIKETIH
jgi:hypothetical protein